MPNTVFALFGHLLDRMMLKLWIITNNYGSYPYSQTPHASRRNALRRISHPMALTQSELAQAIAVPYQRINEIVNGRRGITPSTALRLGQFFGMSPDFWMNLQQRWDLYPTQLSEAKALQSIKPFITVR
jgi:antitoxin HigA-1